MPRVLVTGAEQHYVVAAMRGLRRGGFEVTAAASSPPALGHASRWASATVWVPDAHVDPGGHVDAIRDALASTPHDVVLAGDEASLIAISERRDAVTALATVGLPPHAVVLDSLDKVRQLEAASAAGMRIPETVVCVDDDAASAAAARLGFPVVVKARRSQVSTDRGLVHLKSAIVASEDRLREVAAAAGSPFLVQAPVRPSTVHSFSGVFAGGALVAEAFSRYRRTWPREGGSASFSETLDAPSSLRLQVVRFLEEIGHEGIFEVEFVGGAGNLTFIDLNPRLYGSLTLAIEAGANLPATWCRWLLGEGRARARASAGHRYRWEEGEVRNVLDALRRRRLREAVDVVVPRRRVVHALFRLDDPRPAITRFAYALERRGGSWPHRARGRARAVVERLGRVMGRAEYQRR